MFILRVAISILKTLMLLGLIESVAPGFGYEIGLLLGELLGEGINSGRD